MESTLLDIKQPFIATSFKEFNQAPEKQLTGAGTAVFPVVRPSVESLPETSYLLSYSFPWLHILQPMKYRTEQVKCQSLGCVNNCTYPKAHYINAPVTN